MHFTYTDVNEAFFELHTIKLHFSEWENTRNGRALVFKEPMLITHASPYRKVLFDPIRNANPFFHFMEAIWMLAGSNSVKFPATFSKQIAEYSDNGFRFHGAYGHRWRHHFNTDQLDTVIYMLKKDLNTRRAVLTMWDPDEDLESFSKDLPCNTQIYFRVQGDTLDMTVCNRSNDMVWGMLGANMVHMSYLHEYIARTVGVNVGCYHQFTNNLHVYQDWVDRWNKFSEWNKWYLENPTFQRWPWDSHSLDIDEAAEFVQDPEDSKWECRVLRDNAVPMYEAWRAYKDDSFALASHIAKRIYDEDWREACIQWIKRTEARRNEGELAADRR